MPKINILFALLALMFVGACGSDETTTTDVPTATTPDVEPEPVESGTGTIAVSIEDGVGVFIEGFEIGLRFETADGEMIDATLWSDFVAAQGEATIEDYYDSVLEQPVPSGDVVVRATANIGIGPGPEIPDVDGEMRCRLDVTVLDGETVEVEVTFADTNCLRLR